MISLVIPVYKNSDNIEPLIEALLELDRTIDQLEVVFVVDGSPDDSYLQLANRLPELPFKSQLLLLSRNFGSFSAIRAGLEAANGTRFAVMAADLQEPPELILEFERLLASGEAEVVVGKRVERSDPFMSRMASGAFWGFYRWFIQPEVPEGGADIFGCQKKVRDQILMLKENNSSLVGLLFWVGYVRQLVPYVRREREVGTSAWTYRKRIRYLVDSIYSFSDLPIRLLTRIGVVGLLISVVMAIAVLISKMLGGIPVPGYAATVLTVVFFGALNCFGLGIIGNYVYRTFENTKYRPNFIIASRQSFDGDASPGTR